MIDGKMKKLAVIDSPQSLEYFEACARIRNITLTALINRVLKAVADDQLVYAILDDQSIRNPRPGEYRYRGPR